MQLQDRAQNLEQQLTIPSRRHVSDGPPVANMAAQAASLSVGAAQPAAGTTLLPSAVHTTSAVRLQVQLLDTVQPAAVRQLLPSWAQRTPASASALLYISSLTKWRRLMHGGRHGGG